MTVRLITLGTAALSIALAGCQRESTQNAPVMTTTPAGGSLAPPAAAAEERDNALVRVVHAVPAATAVDVYAGDARVFDGVEYKAVSNYREVPGERFAFTVRSAGAAQGEPLATNSEGLDDGNHYTMFALPDDDGGTTLRIVEDDHEVPANGKARLRVVHASKDVGDIDVMAAGRKDPVVDGVNFQGVSTYHEIDPVAGTLAVRPDGEEIALFTLRDVRFDAGKTYTLVVVGRAKATPKLDAFVIEDVAGTAPSATTRN